MRKAIYPNLQNQKSHSAAGRARFLLIFCYLFANLLDYFTLIRMLATEMGISGENGGSGDEVESLKGQGFYKDKPEWKDVIPIDSVDGDDGDEPVVSIAYSEKFKDVFSYVWAVKSSGELSPRVLDLTRDAIKLDAANYTVWQLRRDALQALKIPHLATEAGLGPDFEKEFELNSEILKHHPKNYQPWQHEKALLSLAIGYQEEVGLDQIQVTNAKILEPILERELKLTERMLGADPKNYHAWQHRQWVLGVFKGCFPSLAGEELAFVKTLLENDARNNSAWNQRYFVFLDLFGNFSVKAVAKEVAQTWEFVKADAGNEQAWSHLLSILNLVDPNFQISDQKKVVIEAKDHGSIVFIPYSPLTMLLTCLLIVGAVNDLPDAELSPEEEVRDHLRRPNNGNCAIGEISRLLFSAGDPVLLPNNFGVLEWKMLCPVGCGSILSLADRNMASLRNHMVRPACAQSPNRRTTWRDHIISKLMDYQIRYLYAEYEAFRLAPDFAWMQDYRSEEEEMLLILNDIRRTIHEGQDRSLDFMALVYGKVVEMNARLTRIEEREAAPVAAVVPVTARPDEDRRVFKLKFAHHISQFQMLRRMKAAMREHKFHILLALGGTVVICGGLVAWKSKESVHKHVFSFIPECCNPFPLAKRVWAKIVH